MSAGENRKLTIALVSGVGALIQSAACAAGHWEQLFAGAMAFVAAFF